MTEENGSLLESVAPRLEALVGPNAVVGRVLSVDGRHVVPLVELSLSLGGAGGQGEGDDPDTGLHGSGSGGAAGGGAKATPVAVLVVENGNIRLETLGH
ncbi:MAG: spore germination protein GerW family protein [Myxococcota bacterium]